MAQGEVRTRNSSCDDSDHLHSQREEQDVVVSSQQLQQQLQQIYALLDMEQEHELHLHHAVPPQSPSQHQWSSSPSSSSLVLSASSATTAFCQQPAQASSLDTPFSPFPYGYLETIPNLNREEIMSQARHKDGSGTSAFRQYVRHLHPKKKLKQGACGQRAIKTAMSVLVKMHSARLSQRQRQSSRTEMAAPAVPSSDESNNIQLQHLLSERKRREKINDSFDALRNALPPSSKRDKTSILMRARDYINSLQSRVSELEEKGMALESQLCIDYGYEQDVNGYPEKIEQQ
ncbi:transcription factor BHLH148 isoform X2 [Sorghum bicolor]|uniref:transcription factor BHLH148 isoform X2 n=1 Tax=Sorghum bicolor TaxID=4558 RepID=UPI000B423E26|nr:transcription factor BHLH148 isoform X2 [Sorghum bicolor]|eukprot:XP_021302889.1 transcription factor BHLH148 isoform X2 [Sorghum bicolor]